MPGRGTVTAAHGPCWDTEAPGQRSCGDQCTRTVVVPARLSRRTIWAGVVRTTVPGGLASGDRVAACQDHDLAGASQLH